MKVQINFTVDIDPAKWTLNYGTEGRKEICQDVKEYIRQAAEVQLESVGVLKEAEREEYQ